jgi:hypothetical protein
MPDDEIIRFLQERAAAYDRLVHPVDAHEVVTRPLAATREGGAARRRPALAGAAAALVLIAAVAGFAAGRGTASKATTVAAGSSPTTTAPVEAHATAGLAAAGADGRPAGSLTRLFDRTTADGVALHGFLIDTSRAPTLACTAPDGAECPPPPCAPKSSFLTEVATDAIANQVPMMAFADSEPTGASSLAFGQPEGAPVAVTTVEVAADVVHVAATWADGTVDEMDVVQGWAALAHLGSELPTVVVATHADGTTSEVTNATTPPMPSCAGAPATAIGPGAPPEGGGTIIGGGTTGTGAGVASSNP